MSTAMLFELIGYIGSLLVAISLMMRSILKLRVINLVGALFFTIYGVLIRAYPVAAMNFFIVLIDLYYLYQMLSTREFFQLLEVRPDSEYLQYFLTFYGEDIRRFQPGFDPRPGADQLNLFILRNLVPAGLVIGEMRETGSLYLKLDYALAGYRDLKTGRFVFQDHQQALRARGIEKVYSEPGAPAHARYLSQMGFTPASPSSGQSLYCLALTEK